MAKGSAKNTEAARKIRSLVVEELTVDEQRAVLEYVEELAAGGDGSGTAKRADGVEDVQESSLFAPGVKPPEEYEDNVPSYIEAAGDDPETYR